MPRELFLPRVQIVVELDESTFTPQSPPDIFSGNYASFGLQQDHKQLERLVLQRHPQTLFPELSGAWVSLKHPKVIDG